MPARSSQDQSKDDESNEVAHSERHALEMEDILGADRPDTSTIEDVSNNEAAPSPARRDVNASAVSFDGSTNKLGVHETLQRLGDSSATVNSAEQNVLAVNAVDPELVDQREEPSNSIEQALVPGGNVSGDSEDAVETAPSAAGATALLAVTDSPNLPDAQSGAPTETTPTSNTTQTPIQNSKATKATAKPSANSKTKKSTSGPKQPRKPRKKKDVHPSTTMVKDVTPSNPMVRVAQMVPRDTTTTDTEDATVGALETAQADATAAADTVSPGETADAPTAVIAGMGHEAAAVTRGRRRAETPSDAEEHEIDPASTTLLELTRDTRRGKKSQLETAMQGIDWKDVARKRREQDERIAAGEAQAVSADASTRLDAAGASVAIGAAAEGTQQGPRLKLVNGALVVDASSLIVSRRGAAGLDAPQGGYEELEESDLTRRINSQSWLYASKREPRERTRAANRSDPWTRDETEAFWEALRMFGTDFECISRMFVGRTRRHIKLKFTREERAQPARMRAALVGETLEMDMGRYCEATGREEGEYMDPRRLEEELKQGEEAHRIEMERQRGVQAETQKQRLEAEKAKAQDSGAGRKGRGRRKQAEAEAEAAGEVLVEDVPDDIMVMPGER